ncbi:MAG: PrsW family glutamic-type intramembrane protease [Candidatus Hodarchaeota archaeon]
MWSERFQGISVWPVRDTDSVTIFIGVSFVALALWLSLLFLTPFFPSLAPIAFYCGPFLFAPVWTAIAIWIFRKNSNGFCEKDQLKLISLPFLAVVCTVAFSALILNSNATLLSLVAVEIADNAGFHMDEKFILVLIIGFVAPCIEELIKLLPVLLLSQATTEKPLTPIASTKRTSAPLFTSVRLPMLLGIIAGSAFVVLETYFYMFYISAIYSEDFSESELVDFRYLQLFLRTIGPLHVLTAAISGLGVGLALLGSRHSEKSKVQWYKALIAFLVAWGLHAAWNTVAVLSDTEEEASFALQDNLLFVGMAIGVLVLLMGLIPTIGLRHFTICPGCGIQKTTEYCSVCQEVHLRLYPKSNLLFWQKGYVKCPRCKEALERLGSCKFCNSQFSLTCPNCWHMVGGGEKNCQNCGEQLQLIAETLPREHLSRLDALARGSVAIFAIWMIPVALGMLTLAAYLEEFDALFVVTGPFVLAGFAAILGLMLEEKSATRAAGRYIIAMIFSTLILSFGLFVLIVTELAFFISFQVSSNFVSFILSLTPIAIFSCLILFLSWLVVRHLANLHLVFPLSPEKTQEDHSKLKWSGSSDSKLAPENILVGMYAFGFATGLYMVIVQVWLIATGEFSVLPLIFLGNLEIGFILTLILLLFLAGPEVNVFYSFLLLWACWGFTGFLFGVRYGRTARFAMILATAGPFIGIGVFIAGAYGLLLAAVGHFAFIFTLAYIFTMFIGFLALAGLFLGFPALITVRWGESYCGEKRAMVKFGRLYQPTFLYPPLATPQRPPLIMEREAHERR